MQNDRQRMLAPAQAADKIVCNAGAECGNDPDDEIKRRDSCVDLLDQQHAGKCDGVKDPLHRSNFFTQNKDRDDAREYRRQVLDRHRRCKRNVLQRDEEKKQCGRTENSAKKKQHTIRAAPIGVRAIQTDNAERACDRRAKEHDLHRRDVRDLLYENIRKRKGERR